MNTNKRTYKSIKWILRNHIKNDVRSLWTYEDDNFRMIYENYSGDSRIYTAPQMLKLIENLIKDEAKRETK